MSIQSCCRFNTDRLVAEVILCSHVCTRHMNNGDPVGIVWKRKANSIKSLYTQAAIIVYDTTHGNKVHEVGW